GKKMGMILTGTPGFRCKRIESGLLSAGQDFTYHTNPYDVGLGKYVDLKKNYFIGKSALETADKDKRCWGIRVENGTALKGSYIKLNSEIVGKVTSSTWSPFQKCGVGIVLLNNTKHKPGIIVDVDCNDNKTHKGEICTLPMYDFKNEIVRGLKTDIPKGPSPWSGIKKK
ncbi:aminomethyl transferase family protein, partial [Candidatus Pelagibacter sp.]|nr:aminomethyl transferase family protein [Candidatus Pelagibacter sp.]